MKAIICIALAGVLAGSIMSAETPAELRAKAIELLKSGKDNEALATMEKLLRVETPKDKGLPATEEEAPKPGVAKVFDSLHKNGFRLQREPGPSSDAKPAEFTFTHTYLDGGDTSYGADFFLGWTPPGQPHSMKLELSTQGKLHTGDEAKDAWIFRISDDISSKAPGFDRLHTTISLKEESNVDFDVNRLSGEIVLTPTLVAVAMGQYLPIADRDPETGESVDDPAVRPAFQFRWRPYIGGDFGTWLGNDIPTGERETSARGYARLTADLRLNWLAAALSLHDAALFADETVCITDGAGDHSYLKAGLNLMINDNVGFAVTYKVGEDAPTFADEHEITGSLTVKF